MKKLADKKSNKKLSPKRRPVGRPNGSSSVRVVPVLRDEIDVQELGRAALRLAMMPTVDTTTNTTNNERISNET